MEQENEKREKTTEKTDDLVIDFLKYALNYLETRVNLLDNKASIFIAIQGALFTMIAYIAKDIFLTELPSIINTVCYTFIVLEFLLVTVTILLLIQVVRPSKIFGSRCSLKRIQMEAYVMWPLDGFPKSEANYREEVESLDQSKIKENYEDAHFNALQLIRRKYKYYRWAIISMKLMILFGFIGFVILGLLKFINWSEVRNFFS